MVEIILSSGNFMLLILLLGQKAQSEGDWALGDFMRPDTFPDGADLLSEANAVELSRLRAAIWRQPRLRTSSASRRRVRGRKPKRSECAPARLIRRYPFTGACIGLAVLTGCWLRLLGAAPSVAGLEYEPPRDMRLAARAAMDVADILDVIGHGVSIREIEAPYVRDRWSASYRLKERKIRVDSSLHFTDDQLLVIMGHECVHALFHQLDLLDELTEEKFRHQYAIQETAATVLGAHLAGKVRSRRGGDGRALIEKCLCEEKAACSDYSDTRAIDRRRPFAAYLRHDGPWVTKAFRTAGFFGGEGLVDAMDEICRENPDPVVAARIIAERFHNVDAETAKKMALPVSWSPRRNWW